MIGKALIYNSSLSPFEKIYIRIFGAPINGLRIRARRILPLVTSNYKNIMDVGCGSGVFTFELAKRLPESTITGIDINHEIIDTNKKITEKLDLNNCSFEYADITEMNIKERFDLILTVDNLEHIEDDEDALKRFFNALTKKGEIIIHVPGYYRRWLFFGWSVNFDVEGHFRPGYTKEQITEKVEKAGFKIIDSYYTYGWIETITNNISYLITKARMRNKILYSIIFPFLLFLSYFGKKSRPIKGAGVLIKAKK